MQRKVLSEIKAAGGIARVVVSVEEAVALLDKLDKKR